VVAVGLIGQPRVNGEDEIRPDATDDAQQVAPDEAQRRSVQDVRAPGPWRSNGPIMQQGAFGTAFGCKAGTPMQRKPEDRIGIFR